MRKISFFLSLIVVLFQTELNAKPTERAISLSKIITLEHFSSLDVTDSFLNIFVNPWDRPNAEDLEYLKSIYQKRFNDNASFQNELGYTYLEIEGYIGAGQVGKALVTVNNYCRKINSVQYNHLLIRTYKIYSKIYDAFSMPGDMLTYESKTYNLIAKTETSESKLIEAQRLYSWAYTRAGWELKNKAYMDSALKIMKNVLLKLQNKRPLDAKIFDCYGIYLLNLARLKKYNEIITVGQEALKYLVLKFPDYKGGESATIATFRSYYCKIGIAYCALDNRDSAYFYLNKPINFNKEKLPTSILYPKNGKFIDFIYWKDIVEAHMHFNEYEEAARLLDLALYSRYKIEDQDYIPFLYKLGCKIYPKVGMYKKAVECYRESKLIEVSNQVELENNYEMARNTSTEIQLKDAEETSRLEKIEIELQTKKEKDQKRLILILSSIGLLGLLIFIGFQYNRFLVIRRQKTIIESEKKRSEELLLNILPEEVADELKNKGSADAKLFEEVTVMFTDFKDFTRISETLSPAELVAEIHYCFKAFDDIITRHNIEKIKTIGDAYMCVGGLPIFNTTHAIDVISAAIEIQEFIAQHIKERESQGKKAFEIRIGIHTGNVVAGIVGVKKFAYDIWGDTVNIASRMESNGEAGKINVSGSTYALIKDQYHCIYRGKIEAKGKGELDMYFVEGLI